MFWIWISLLDNADLFRRARAFLVKAEIINGNGGEEDGGGGAVITISGGAE